jgi:uncharacterized membrane protein YoaK (UPF0700 family)
MFVFMTTADHVVVLARCLWNYLAAQRSSSVVTRRGEWVGRPWPRSPNRRPSADCARFSVLVFDLRQDIRADGTDNKPTGLLLVGSLAALAGAVDACGLSLLKNFYVSFMSGNTTSLGRAVAQGDWTRVALLAQIVGVFVAGAAAGEAMAIWTGRFKLPSVVLGAAVVLAIPPIAHNLAVPAMTFAMGGLNASMQKAGPLNVSVTFATGALVRFGQGLTRFVFGRGDGAGWIQQAVPWFGLLMGAIAATAAMGVIGMRTLTFLPALALAVTVAAYFAVPRDVARI